MVYRCHPHTVAYKLSKTTGSDELIESLHWVLYKRKGKVRIGVDRGGGCLVPARYNTPCCNTQAHSRKRDVGQFSGFVHDTDDERTRFKERFAKWTVEQIHKLMDLLDMPRGTGDKAAKVQRVMEFLDKPTQLSTVDLAAKDAKKKEAAKRKRGAGKTTGAKKAGSAKKKAPAGKKTMKKEEEEEMEEDVEEESEEESEEEESEEEAETPPPKPARKRQAKVGFVM